MYVDECGELTCELDDKPEQENCFDNPMPSVVESILMTFLMSTGDLSGVWGSLNHTRHAGIGKVGEGSGDWTLVRYNGDSSSWSSSCCCSTS